MNRILYRKKAHAFAITKEQEEICSVRKKQEENEEREPVVVAGKDPEEWGANWRRDRVAIVSAPVVGTRSHIKLAHPAINKNARNAVRHWYVIGKNSNLANPCSAKS